jgi:hypothetical protein
MPVNDCATLEAEIAKDEPSRLPLEIALRRPLAPAAPAYDGNEIQRAIRDGFREIFAGVELQRLMKAGNAPKSRASRWIGRVVAFTFCAAIGSAATLILSASHGPRPYALGSLTPPAADQEAAASLEGPSPGLQSTGAPVAWASGAPVGPATVQAAFGLHEQ